jgi:hypothetical protein
VSSGGIIFGLPTETGTFNFTVQVNDGAGNALQKGFSMVVREPLPYDSQFIAQTIVPPVQAGQQFGAVLKAQQRQRDLGWLDQAVAQNPANTTGGRLCTRFQSYFKGLPRDIRLTGIAPRIAGTHDFQWQLYQEGRGFLGQSSTNVRIIVTAGPLSIDSPVPPPGFVGSSFSYQLTAIGGTPPHIWSLASGSLPSGLVLDPISGLISGIPTLVGASTFAAQVTDSGSRLAQKEYSITVAPAPASPLRLSVAALIQAVMGTPINYQPEAIGGTLPYTWSITAGALPAGLALSNISGALGLRPLVISA